MIKTLTITILILFCMACNSNPAYGQSKKSVPDSLPPKKQYVFILDPASSHVMDSILFVAYRTAGYELSKKDGDGLIGGLAMIINYFQSVKKYQDSVYNAALIKPKK